MKMNKKYIAIITLCVALISPFACSKSFLETYQYFSILQQMLLFRNHLMWYP